MLSARPKALIVKTVALAAIVLLMGMMLFLDPTADYDPTPMGVSGGNTQDSWRFYCCSGTLGSLVQDGTGKKFILSNNHVLARLNKASIGEDVSQPGLIDTNCSVVDVVADLSDYVPMSFDGSPNTVDAAIAEIRPTEVDASGAILNIGVPSGGTVAPANGMPVQKNGRTSNYTTGTITGLDFSGNVGYSSKCGGRVDRVAYFTGSFLVTPGSFSTGGDSGSLILAGTGPGQPAVGLLYAGSSSYTIAAPIDDVLSAFNVTLVGGPPPATGSISGTVTSAADGSPIAGASVSTDTGQSDTSDGAGDYSLTGVPTGSRTVTASAAGFQSAQQGVSVTANNNSVADFVLTEAVVPTQAIVECITYTTSGGQGGLKNMYIEVYVVDDFGGPVSGAGVSVSVQGLGTASGTTDSGGRVSFRARNAANTCYTTDVTALTASGLTWDGLTPANGFEKGTDAQPDADCRDNNDPCGTSSPASAAGSFAGGFSPDAAGGPPVDAIQRAIEVKRRHERRILSVEGVAGIAVGMVDRYEVIQVFLEEDKAGLRDMVPSDLEGIPVQIIVSGPFVAR